MYKGENDPFVCGSYRAVILLEQHMQMLERVLEKMIRCQVSIDGMQFGFMPSKGTSYDIFIMRQIQVSRDSFEVKVGLHQGCILSSLRVMGVEIEAPVRKGAVHPPSCCMLRTDLL